VNGGTFTANGTNLNLGVNGGSGQLNVSNHGTATINCSSTFRTYGLAGSNNQVNVTSGGTMNVVSNANFTLGNATAGENSLTVDGGTASFTKLVYMNAVAGTEHSVIDLKSGSMTLTGGLTAGYNTGASSNVYIRGGSMVCDANVIIGKLGFGTVNMTDGLMSVVASGTGTNQGILSIGTGVSGGGSFYLDGGVLDLTASGGLTIGSAGLFDINGGTLKLAGQVTSLSGVTGNGILGNLFFDYHAGEGANGITYVTVPEPATIGLMVIGLVMAGRRRK
jgi:hypothetical protein